MTYQVLARQWRPQNFDDVIGQDYTVRALSYALEHQKLHSAYLFTGSHGIGKTSLARIVARAINCERGISAKPCDTCTACVNMLAGRAVDVIEIDAASRTKVEDTRELLDQVQYAPTLSPYKIYIIDEVHMLSTHSFNALLKTLEEPPAHVLFLLATTHPDKLPVTVRSRCLQFHLRPMLSTDIEKQLTHITSAESIATEPLALTAIAKAARGSMRDALSLLDQAIAVGQGQIKLTDVNAMLGLASIETLHAIVDGLLARDLNSLIQTVRLKSQWAATLPVQLLELLQQAALYQFAPATAHGQDEPNALVVRLATTLHQEALQLYYQLSLHAIEDIAKSPSPLLAVEMWLLRLVHFDIATNTQVLSLPPTHKQKVDTEHAQGVPLQTTTDTSPAMQAPQNTPTPIADSEQLSETPSVMPSHITTQRPIWSALLPQLGLTGMVRILAEQADIHWIETGKAELRLAKSQAGLCQPAHIEAITAALSNHYRQPIQLTLNLVDSQVDSPSALATQQHQSRITEVHADPKIQAFVEEFDATIGTMALQSEVP